MMHEQGSPEWLKERLGKFTASNIYKLMGIPRSKTETLTETAKTYILERVAEKLTGIPVQIDTAATEWGKDNEPLARKWYAKLTGNQVEETGFHDWGMNAGGSPDGLIIHATGAPIGIIEIKCPFNTANHLRHLMIDSVQYFKENHPEYYYQIQMNLMATQTGYADFISFDPRINEECGLFVFRVPRIEADQLAIRDKIFAAIEYMEQVFNRVRKPALQ